MALGRKFKVMTTKNQQSFEGGIEGEEDGGGGNLSFGWGLLSP